MTDLRKQAELVGDDLSSPALRDLLMTLLERVEALEQPRPFMEGVPTVEEDDARFSEIVHGAPEWPRWPTPIGLNF